MFFIVGVEQDCNPSEILIINVGGAKLFVKRSALTHVEGSKLARMFSGRWDHVLPRDHSGRIFLDLDINWFHPITNLLSELSGGAAADELQLPVMQLSDDDRLGLQACAELFGLCDVIPTQGVAGMPHHITSVARLGQESGLEIGRYAPWQLLYHSSVDGATAHEFHRLCDDKPNTVCLAVDDKGNVFGGFALVPWTSSGGWQRDPAVFLFCQGSESTAVQRYSPRVSSPYYAVCHDPGWGPIQSAVFHHSSYGPVFGNGYDLVSPSSGER
ncbi:hypothetical protein JKP88DRAFT_171266 [Tribonema minus]|uniref:TLDc domain-containing protein n=1 Tax=Tribonema minus TaxID=303371 RepID=A0A835YIU4_9STRA|nr:hypothetical protein JKP88DRAFT_171266 [Tribonema minus]